MSMVNEELSISNICIHRRLVSNITQWIVYSSSFLLSSYGSRNGITTETLGQIIFNFLHFFPRRRNECSIVSKRSPGADRINIESLASRSFSHFVLRSTVAEEENRFLLAPVPIRK